MENKDQEQIQIIPNYNENQRIIAIDPGRTNIVYGIEKLKLDNINKNLSNRFFIKWITLVIPGLIHANTLKKWNITFFFYKKRLKVLT